MTRNVQPPMVEGAPFLWPLPDEEVRAALERAFADGSWGKYHGPNCKRLEETLGAMHGSDHVLLTCSGTMGVELALRGVGVRAGDEVALAGYDFPGNFRAIEAIGARPVLVDIDPATWCIDAKSLQHDGLNGTGSNIRAVLVSHLHGGLAPMRAIMQIAKRHGWQVVEDACQAPGAVVDGHLAGTWGDVGVLSFGGSKLLTAGRGGALITRSENIVQRAKIFAERGNNAFPLSELQAAVLPPQLAKLNERHAHRAERVLLLRELTEHLGDTLVPVCKDGLGQPAYFKFAWRYQPDQKNSVDRSELLAMLQAEGVPVDVGFRGFARRSERRCRKVGTLDASQVAAEQTVLLHHPVLLEEERILHQIADALAIVVRRASPNRAR